MLAALGVLILGVYAPTFYRLSQNQWWLKEYSHAPLIILISCWLVWQERKLLREPLDGGLHPAAFGVFLSGLFIYWLGMVQNVLVLELFSFPLVVMGVYYFLAGKAALRWWFPCAYLVFIIPPPLFVVDMITFPLKKVISWWAAGLLGLMGYPIVKKGVLLSIGDYNLLVADACSGMRSIISLLALISLYVYLQKSSWQKNCMVLSSIIPIALVANTIRVVLLALITYHYGEAAGQSYYHDFSGFLVFALALACIMAVDKLVQALPGCHEKSSGAGAL